MSWSFRQKINLCRVTAHRTVNCYSGHAAYFLHECCRNRTAGLCSVTARSRRQPQPWVLPQQHCWTVHCDRTVTSPTSAMSVDATALLHCAVWQYGRVADLSHECCRNSTAGLCSVSVATSPTSAMNVATTAAAMLDCALLEWPWVLPQWTVVHCYSDQVADLSHECCKNSNSIDHPQ